MTFPSVECARQMGRGDAENDEHRVQTRSVIIDDQVPVNSVVDPLCACRASVNRTQ